MDIYSLVGNKCIVSGHSLSQTCIFLNGLSSFCLLSESLYDGQYTETSPKKSIQWSTESVQMCILCCPFINLNEGQTGRNEFNFNGSETLNTKLSDFSVRDGSISPRSSYIFYRSIFCNERGCRVKPSLMVQLAVMDVCTALSCSALWQMNGRRKSSSSGQLRFLVGPKALSTF